jgi:hypothetical protein
MAQRGSGAVLNVGSLFSNAPAPRLATYAASKAAVYSFTEALHTELRAYRVAVTALCPGRENGLVIGVELRGLEPLTPHC